MTIIPEPRKPRCFPGRPGRAILARIPTLSERPSASTSIRTRSSASPRKASTGPKNSCSPRFSFRWRTQASLEGVNWLEQRRAKSIFSIVRIKDGVTLPQARAELDAIAARIRRQYPVGRRGAGIQAVPSRPDGRHSRRAGARFSGRGDGAGRDCAARRLRQPRQPVRGANGGPRPRDRHPHGHRVQPLARSPPGAGGGLADFDSRRRVRLRPIVDRPHRPGELASAHRLPHEILCTAAALVDPDGVADLGARRRSVRSDAAAADLQDRSQ